MTLSPTQRKAALDAFNADYDKKTRDDPLCIMSLSDWLRSWELATEALNAVIRQELRKHLSSPIAAEDVLDGIRQLAQVAKTWEDNCNDALAKETSGSDKEPQASDEGDQP